MYAPLLSVLLTVTSIVLFVASVTILPSRPLLYGSLGAGGAAVLAALWHTARRRGAARRRRRAERAAARSGPPARPDEATQPNLSVGEDAAVQRVAATLKAAGVKSPDASVLARKFGTLDTLADASWDELDVTGWDTDVTKRLWVLLHWKPSEVVRFASRVRQDTLAAVDEVFPSVMLLAAATDAMLLSLPGVGPATAREMRSLTDRLDEVYDLAARDRQDA